MERNKSIAFALTKGLPLARTLGQGDSVDSLGDFLYCSFTKLPMRHKQMENHQIGSIIIVDDNALVRLYLSSILMQRGHHCIDFADAPSALRHLAEAGPATALILSDIDMPGMSGVEFLREVRRFLPATPFILFSAFYEEPLALEALRAGSTDYLLKPAMPDEILSLANKHLIPVAHESKALARKALAHCFDTLRLSNGDQATQLAPLFDMLGVRRFETMQHSQRVAAYSLLIAVAHGLDPRLWGALEAGALLHDIGKAAIPHNVLMRDGPLSPEDWRVMKMHPRIGFELISAIQGASAEADVVYCHHERFDGTGYPQRLAGGAIPLNARIFALADALDAICSDRPYRAGRSIEEARAEIERAAGSHFDPALVRAFRLISDQDIENIQLRFPDEERRFRDSLVALSSVPETVPTVAPALSS
jgi:response regulator RpfG family c-di-GMP phosphodiesterase